MKYYSTLFLLLFLFFACTEKQSKNNENDQVIIECQKILKEWNIEANISQKDKVNDLKLSIEIIKPTVSHKDHASIIASCLVVKHLSLPKTKTITIDISAQIDNLKTPLSGVTYSQENIKSLTALYRDAPLLRLNEYCIKNFDHSTPNDLEVLMTKNHTLEKWSIEGSFFQLLYQFFKESKGYEKGNGATLTMFFLFLTTNDFMTGTEMEHHSKHIKNLWKILKNEDIRDFEKQFIKIIDRL